MTSPGQERALDDLAQEYVQRLRDGEPVGPEDYCAAHPDLAGRIRELFPVLAMMEGLGPGAKPSAPALPGDGRIGAYRLVREIGQGGMGRVFEGVGADGQRAAIKLVHPHLVGQPAYLARFLREFEAGQRVDHDAVVRTLGSGIVDLHGVETPYLVLEYIEGQNLRDLISELAPLSERLCRLLGRKIAAGLDALHRCDLVHRDVKPDNVVITHDESVKLMDLGVALVRDAQLKLSATGDFIGSFLYAAPEQIHGDPTDARSDLYSLGMLLFEAATGRHPEAGEDGSAPRTRTPAFQAPSVREYAPATSRFFDRVVATLMAPRPADRFDSAADVLRVLRDGEAGPWWEAKAAADARPGQHGPSRPDLYATPLIGRTRELQALRDAGKRVRQGRGSAWLVVGEAGMGKSRLLAAWLDALEGTGSPRLVFAEHDPGTHETRTAALVPALRAALGDDGLSGPELVQRVRAFSRKEPLVIVVEDLHFASAESQRLFAALVGLVRYEPVVVVGTTRIESDAFWDVEPSESYAQRIVLQGLSSTNAHDLFRARLGSNTPHASDVVEFVRASGGNPFCVIAFAETLKARGTLSGARFPASIEDLVASKLRDLDETSRALLDVAACAGNVFDPIVVCDAAEVPHIRGLQALHELDRARGLIAMQGRHYVFRHHVVLEVLYAALPPALRSAYHTVLGDALQRSLGDKPPSRGRAFRIARHFLRGTHPERAAPFAQDGISFVFDNCEYVRTAKMGRALVAIADQLDAASRAHVHHVLGLALLNTGATREGLDTLEVAFHHRHDIKPPHAPFPIATDYAFFLSLTGDTTRAIEIQRQALADADAAGNRDAFAHVAVRLALLLGPAGHLDEAKRVAQQSLEIAREISDLINVSEAARCLGDLEMESGRLDLARPLLSEALEAAHAAGDATRASALSSFAKLDGIEGRYQSTLDKQVRLIATARVLGHMEMEAGARINAAQALLELGRFEEAAPECEATLDLARRASMPVLTLHAELVNGLLHEWRGNWGQADLHYAAAERAARPDNLVGARARVHACRATLWAWLGDFDGAQAHVEAGMQDLQSASITRGRSQLAAARAAIDMARGDYAAARASLTEALARVEQSGFVGEQVKLLQRLGMAAQAAGDLEAAGAYYATGIERVGTTAGVSSRVLRALKGSLPGGAAAVAVLSLDEHAGALPAHESALTRAWLAAHLDDETQRIAASGELACILATVPEAQRAASYERVPLHRALADVEGPTSSR